MHGQMESIVLLYIVLMLIITYKLTEIERANLVFIMSLFTHNNRASLLANVRLTRLVTG